LYLKLKSDEISDLTWHMNLSL